MPNLLSNTVALVGGAAVGAAAMYLLDPDQGHGRRQDVAGSAADAVSSTRKAVRTSVAGASDSAHSVANTIGKYARDLASQVGDQVDDTADAVRGSVSRASDSAHSVASRIASYAKELAGRVSGHVHDTADTLHDAADSAVDTVRSARNQASSRAADAVSSAKSQGWSAYQQARKQAKATQDDWQDRATSLADRARAAGRRALGVAEPEHHTAAKAAGITAGTVGVLVLGAGLMYYLDPQKGRARRAVLRDRLDSAARQSGHKVRQYGHHLGNKAQGYAAQARDAVPEEWVDKAKSAVASVTAHVDSATDDSSTPSARPLGT
jgi:gas vesicle protein